MSIKDTVSIGLSAAILSVECERPFVLVVAHEDGQDALPFGPFDPAHHRTLESGLRKWVGEQTKFELGYTEQLYTFGDKGRHLPSPGSGGRVVSVGYLALTRQFSSEKVREAPGTQWGMRLYRCKSSKIMLATKQDDWTIPEFDASIQANAAGQVLDINTPN